MVFDIIDDKIQYNGETYDGNLYDSDCPVLYALNIIGQKWKLPILWKLMLKDVTRYNELKRSLNGITNIMLTKCLRELEEHNLVKRVEYDTKPPKVEYSLTERGKALLPTLNGLYTWGEEQYKLDHEELD